MTCYIADIEKPREIYLLERERQRPYKLIITYFRDLEQEILFVHILGLDASSLLKQSKTAHNLT